VALGRFAAVQAADWLQFGYDEAHSGFNSAETGISAQVGSFSLRYRVHLPTLSDGAPVFLENVTTSSGALDLLFITGSFGDLVAVDAATGNVVWQQQSASGPAALSASVAAVDPNRQYVYSAGLDGKVHKYAVGDGTETIDAVWPETVTLKPALEKVSSALAVAAAGDGNTYLYATTSNFAYDKGDYQGHVTAINLATGDQVVFNAMCSGMPGHLAAAPATPNCADAQAGIWGRAGVIYDPTNDEIYITTGNGLYTAATGGDDWGESVLALPPSLRDANGAELAAPLDSYTPSEYQDMNNNDLDLGVEAPVILPAPAGSRQGNIGAQIGKDGIVRLLNFDNLSGQGGPRHIGGEFATVTTLNYRGSLNSQPAVWTDPDTGIGWLFASYVSAQYGFFLQTGPLGAANLVLAWSRTITGGTSPVVADGVVFLIEETNILIALDATTGALLWSAPLYGVHWASPIVVNGTVYLVDGDGTLQAYSAVSPTIQPLTAPVSKPVATMVRPPRWAQSEADASPSGHPPH
jgi:outer membrane protein assembly factor BamB